VKSKLTQNKVKCWAIHLYMSTLQCFSLRLMAVVGFFQVFVYTTESCIFAVNVFTLTVKLFLVERAVEPVFINILC